MHDWQLIFCGKRYTKIIFLPNTSFIRIETTLLFSWQSTIKLLQSFLKWTHLSNELINRIWHRHWNGWQLCRAPTQKISEEISPKQPSQTASRLYSCTKNTLEMTYSNDSTIKDSVQISEFVCIWFGMIVVQCSSILHMWSCEWPFCFCSSLASFMIGPLWVPERKVVRNVNEPK